MAFECVSALKTEFRVPVKSPETECPRMCKGKFRDSGSTGYGLGELYKTLDDSKVNIFFFVILIVYGVLGINFFIVAGYLQYFRAQGW